MRLTCAVISSFTLLALGSGAYGQMHMRLSPGPEPAIVGFSVVGSSTVRLEGVQSFRMIGVGLDFADGVDPFPANVTNEIGPWGIFPTLGSAALTNETTGESVIINELFFQDSERYGISRFGVSTDGSMGFNHGDTISWIGAGEIDLSRGGIVPDLTFDDFSRGTFTIVDRPDGSPPTGLLGSLIIVPEPATMVMIGAGSAVGLLRRPRRAGQRRESLA